MSEYSTIIKRAISKVAPTEEARRQVYEQARAKFREHIRGLAEPLSEAKVTRQHLSLEQAIRQIEAEALGKPSRQTPDAPDITAEEQPQRPMALSRMPVQSDALSEERAPSRQAHGEPDTTAEEQPRAMPSPRMLAPSRTTLEERPPVAPVSGPGEMPPQPRPRRWEESADEDTGLARKLTGFMRRVTGRRA